MTVISWFESFAPEAWGSERPCSVCIPYELKKPGKLEEHPMPLMVRI
jgi:hypothetical protein